MNSNFKNWYLLPFIFILAIPMLIHSVIYDGSRLIVSFIITLAIPIMARIVFNIKPFLFVILSLPILILAIMYDIMVIEYDSYVNVNTWNSIINSNPAEATEFSSEIRLVTILLGVLQVLTFIFYLFFTHKKTIKKATKKYRLIFLGILCILGIDASVKGATKFSFPNWSLHSLKYYYKVKKQEANYYKLKKNATFYAKRDISEYKEESKETIVIVVGETLRRDHLEYYGYNRPTTPHLKEEDLILFTDVISPANQTVNSLQRAFTLADVENDNEYWKNPSLIKAFKEVGFKTFWVSTQLVYHRYINEVSFIAHECDSIINFNMETFDERLFKPFENILKEKNKKKLIFLHILGTHSAYHKRYPTNYNYFSKEKSSDKRVTIMRQYDDAVRYNDFVLSKFLSKLKKQDGESSFLMFSDHGESLYDAKPNYFNHGSDKPTQSEYDIPFALWLSEEFTNNHKSIVNQININKNKPVILSDFFHSVPALFGIEFDKLIPENNFFGKNYIQKRNRKVVNPSLQILEYDKLKNTKAKIDY